jgi:hypothetical protein
MYLTLPSFAMTAARLQYTISRRSECKLNNKVIHRIGFVDFELLILTDLTSCHLTFESSLKVSIKLFDVKCLAYL